MNIRRRTVLKLPLLAAGLPAVLKNGLAAAGEQLKPKIDAPALLRFGVIGDSGSGKAAQLRVAEQMKSLHRIRRDDPWRFVLAMGDNVYENGESKYFESRFIDVYRELLEGGVPFRSTLGNHDIRYRDGKEQVKEEAFGYIGGKDEYEFAAGPKLQDGTQLARFICLNSTRWVDAIEKRENKAVAGMVDRLREVLKESGRYRWNIIYFHHPLYSYIKKGFLFPKGHGSNLYLQSVIEPEIVDHVDLVLGGHEHFYQKIRPVKGVHHLISGGAGKQRKGVRMEHPNVESASLDYHFMDLGLTEETLRYQAINDAGQLIHSGEIPSRRSSITKAKAA